MIISDGQTSPLLLTIFYVKAYNTSSPFEWLYSVLLVLDGLLIVCSGCLTIYTIYLAFSTNVFHFNINIIYSIFMLHFFELLISRLFIFPYQEGFLPITVPNELTHSLLQYTFDDDTVTKVPNITNLYPLVLGGAIRIRYLLTVCFALPCVAVERCFATWLLQDYEHKKRGQISILPIIIAEIIATAGATAVTLQCISVFTAALCASILTFISYLIFLILKFKTKHLEKKCERNADFYSLSVKFQLTENIRTFKVIHLLVLEVAIMIGTVAVTILLAKLDLLSSSYTLAVFVILDKFIHINPIFICIAVFFVEPRWFRRFVRHIPGRLHRNRTDIFSKYSQDHPAYKTQRLSLADVHFEQLKRLW